MKNNTSKSAEAPGAEATPKTEDVNIEVIKVWLEKDLRFAVSLLTAIHSDPDLIASVATFMFGRLQNQKQKTELDKLHDDPLTHQD